MEETNKLHCPACDVGTLREEHGVEELSYNGQTFVLNNMVYSVCDVCGTEIVIPEQARSNDRLIREEHRRIDGLLPAEKIKDLRRKLKLTQHDASFLFGGGTNAFSKYECSEVIQSVAMDRLLRIVDLVPGAFNVLVQIAYGAPSEAWTVVRASKKFVGCSYATCEVERSFQLPSIRESRPTLTLVKKTPRAPISQVNEQYDEAVG